MTQTNDAFPAPRPAGETLPETNPPPGDPAARPPRGEEVLTPDAPENAPVQQRPHGDAQPGAEPGEEDYGGLQLPAGAEPEEGLLDAFKTLAAELKIPSAAAQRLMDWEFARAERAARTAETLRQEMLQKWADQTKAVLGPRYEENLAKAVRAADVFGGPELRDLLEETGLGNHPVIVKTFYQIGRATGEDVSAGGKETAPGDKTFAQALYGSN